MDEEIIVLNLHFTSKRKKGKPKRKRKIKGKGKAKRKMGNEDDISKSTFVSPMRSRGRKNQSIEGQSLENENEKENEDESQNRKISTNDFSLQNLQKRNEGDNDNHNQWEEYQFVAEDKYSYHYGKFEDEYEYEYDDNINVLKGEEEEEDNQQQQQQQQQRQSKEQLIELEEYEKILAKVSRVKKQVQFSIQKKEKEKALNALSLVECIMGLEKIDRKKIKGKNSDKSKSNRESTSLQKERRERKNMTTNMTPKEIGKEEDHYGTNLFSEIMKKRNENQHQQSIKESQEKEEEEEGGEQEQRQQESLEFGLPKDKISHLSLSSSIAKTGDHINLIETLYKQLSSSLSSSRNEEEEKDKNNRKTTAPNNNINNDNINNNNNNSDYIYERSFADGKELERNIREVEMIVPSHVTNLHSQIMNMANQIEQCQGAAAEMSANVRALDFKQILVHKTLQAVENTIQMEKAVQWLECTLGRVSKEDKDKNNKTLTNCSTQDLITATNILFNVRSSVPKILFEQSEFFEKLDYFEIQIKQVLMANITKAIQNGPFEDIFIFAPLLGRLGVAEQGWLVYRSYAEKVLINSLTEIMKEEFRPIKSTSTSTSINKQTQTQIQAQARDDNNNYPVVLSKIYNQCAVFLNSHLPLVSQGFGDRELNGDGALLQLAYGEVEKLIMNLISSYLDSKRLEIGRSKALALPGILYIETVYNEDDEYENYLHLVDSFFDEVSKSQSNNYDKNNKGGGGRGGGQNNNNNINNNNSRTASNRFLSDAHGHENNASLLNSDENYHQNMLELVALVKLKYHIIKEIDVILDESALILQHSEVFERFVRNLVDQVELKHQQQEQREEEFLKQQKIKPKLEGNNNNKYNNNDDNTNNSSNQDVNQDFNISQEDKNKGHNTSKDNSNNNNNIISNNSNSISKSHKNESIKEKKETKEEKVIMPTITPLTRSLVEVSGFYALVEYSYLKMNILMALFWDENNEEKAQEFITFQENQHNLTSSYPFQSKIENNNNRSNSSSSLRNIYNNINSGVVGSISNVTAGVAGGMSSNSNSLINLFPLVTSTSIDAAFFACKKSGRRALLTGNTHTASSVINYINQILVDIVQDVLFSHFKSLTSIPQYSFMAVLGTSQGQGGDSSVIGSGNSLHANPGTLSIFESLSNNIVEKVVDKAITFTKGNINVNQLGSKFTNQMNSTLKTPIFGLTNLLISHRYIRQLKEHFLAEVANLYPQPKPEGNTHSKNSSKNTTQLLYIINEMDSISEAFFTSAKEQTIHLAKLICVPIKNFIDYVLGETTGTDKSIHEAGGNKKNKEILLKLKNERKNGSSNINANVNVNDSGGDNVNNNNNEGDLHTPGIGNGSNAAVSFDIDEAGYEAYNIVDPYMQGLISYLNLYFNFLSAINPDLDSPDYWLIQDTLIRHISTCLCEELFQHYRQHDFSLYGALQVDKDLRLFCQYWTKKWSLIGQAQEEAAEKEKGRNRIPSNSNNNSSREEGSSHVLPPFSIRKEESYIKLNQMVTLLVMEHPSDLLDMNIQIPTTASSYTLNLTQSSLAFNMKNNQLYGHSYDKAPSISMSIGSTGKGSAEWLFSNVETAEIMKLRKDWKSGEIANAIREACINDSD